MNKDRNIHRKSPLNIREPPVNIIGENLYVTNPPTEFRLSPRHNYLASTCCHKWSTNLSRLSDWRFRRSKNPNLPCSHPLQCLVLTQNFTSKSTHLTYFFYTNIQNQKINSVIKPWNVTTYLYSILLILISPSLKNKDRILMSFSFSLTYIITLNQSK